MLSMKWEYLKKKKLYKGAPFCVKLFFFLFTKKKSSIFGTSGHVNIFVTNDLNGMTCTWNVRTTCELRVTIVLLFFFLFPSDVDYYFRCVVAAAATCHVENNVSRWAWSWLEIDIFFFRLYWSVMGSFLNNVNVNNVNVKKYHTDISDICQGRSDNDRDAKFWEMKSELKIIKMAKNEIVNFKNFDR